MCQKKQSGFTLIEMMVVLLVIAVLLAITIPNVAKHSTNIHSKGCEAFMKMVSAQVEAYKMDHHKIPTIVELKENGYISQTECPDGCTISIAGDGTVVKNGSTP